MTSSQCDRGRCHYSTFSFISRPVVITVRQECPDQTQTLGGIWKGSSHRGAHPIAIQAARKPPSLLFRIGFVRQPAGYLSVQLEPGPLYEPKQLVCIGWHDLNQAVFPKNASSYKNQQILSFKQKIQIVYFSIKAWKMWRRYDYRKCKNKNIWRCDNSTHEISGLNDCFWFL